ncbi:MAG TPA: hypothetical protein VEZ40_07155 [Pyrinomonadaceae bacterium]|nr:hypothetical protein [Pyrinomonadaceae bacterium]
MSEQPPTEADSPDTEDAAAAAPRDLDFAQARLAYSIIQTLLEHTAVLSDLVALMAQVIDEDTTRALTQTPNWTAYLESRRRMEATRADVEKFAAIMKELGEDG